MAMRRRRGERMGERRIWLRSIAWQLWQRTHSRRGSGAPTGSLSAIGENQMMSVQIEQRVKPRQRFLVASSLPLAIFTSCPGTILCPPAFVSRKIAGRSPQHLLQCSRYASLPDTTIVPYADYGTTLAIKKEPEQNAL